MFVSEINFRDQLAIIEDRRKMGLIGAAEDQIGLELHFDDAYQEIFRLFKSGTIKDKLLSTIFVPTAAIDDPSVLMTEVVRSDRGRE